MNNEKKDRMPITADASRTYIQNNYYAIGMGNHIEMVDKCMFDKFKLHTETVADPVPITTNWSTYARGNF